MLQLLCHGCMNRLHIVKITLDIIYLLLIKKYIIIKDLKKT